MDLVASAAGLLLLLPLFAVIAVAIVVESGMPVLFSQTRVGRHGRCFRIWKFRSMRAGAGRRITAGGDARVTRIGRYLRAHKLDELPQLWNVLRGEMSLVGPRPELPEFVARYAESYKEILSVRPGITDPASLAYRNEEQLLVGAANPEAYYLASILPAKIGLSHGYLIKRNLVSDVRILWETARLLLKSLKLKS